MGAGKGEHCSQGAGICRALSVSAVVVGSSLDGMDEGLYGKGQHGQGQGDYFFCREVVSVWTGAPPSAPGCQWYLIDQAGGSQT